MSQPVDDHMSAFELLSLTITQRERANSVVLHVLNAAGILTLGL